MTPAAHYPYSLLGKFVRYPWAKHWKQGRFYRYYAYSIIICLPLFHLIGKAVNSPENLAMWKGIRAERKHDQFAPVKDH
ncbi:hypothetical protein LSH36_17g00030 [Paralvinella palmiformis]|uniref:Uncharacterized protein n=1 Tax=Paralvinella palmiformis TaxID=53620 RepID=A0AAD9KBN6_9ANNE|nr:hypothetical protein LSH36_17g00030 [Paralvinella palmiformis]